ncbi:MAG: type IV pilin protein [Arenicellales bacterium]
MLQIPNRSQAFSLIELLIAVAIIGILAAIAIPMYSDYVTRSRRADGQATLMQVAQELERCYTQFSKYNDDSCSVVSSSGTVNETSDQGFYLVTANNLNESSFTLAATPQNKQANDTDCATLTLNHLGIELPADCW